MASWKVLNRDVVGPKYTTANTVYARKIGNTPMRYRITLGTPRRNVRTTLKYVWLCST